jgi:hypothetical protein
MRQEEPRDEGDMSHEDLESALRGLFRDVDQVPAAARATANAALGWRAVHAELAQLTADSGRELAHLRGAAPRLLTFAGDRMLIELELSPADGAARLLGQLDPPRAAEVTVEAVSGPRTTQADERGRFTVTGLAGGWTRVVVNHADSGAGPVRTEWFLA